MRASAQGRCLFGGTGICRGRQNHGRLQPGEKLPGKQRLVKLMCEACSGCGICPGLCTHQAIVAEEPDTDIWLIRPCARDAVFVSRLVRAAP